jgi:DNA-binding transcriptional LysR family regulator
MLGCVAAGLGVTLLPRALVDGARHAGRIAMHVLPAHEAHVETLFVTRRDAYPSAALRTFLEHVRPPLAQAAA